MTKEKEITAGYYNYKLGLYHLHDIYRDQTNSNGITAKNLAISFGLKSQYVEWKNEESCKNLVIGNTYHDVYTSYGVFDNYGSPANVNTVSARPGTVWHLSASIKNRILF